MLWIISFLLDISTVFKRSTGLYRFWFVRCPWTCNFHGGFLRCFSIAKKQPLPNWAHTTFFNFFYSIIFWSHNRSFFTRSIPVFALTGNSDGLKCNSCYFKPILGGVWHVRWLGGGKFTHPCYLLKYLPKSHQTWQFCCTSDKDQKNIYEVLVFLMSSSKISSSEGQQ